MATNFRGYSQLVIDNLRRTHGEAIAKYTDQQVIDAYADWNMSAKDEDFKLWLDAESTYNEQEKFDGEKA